MKVTFKHRIEYAVVRAMMIAFGYLPEALAYGGVACLGQFYFICSKRRQRYALAFLRQAYPEGKSDRDLLRIARRATGNFMKVGMDMLRVDRFLRRGRLEQRIEGMDEFRERLPPGPLLVVTGHLGAWEIGAMGVAAASDEAHVIARRFKNPLLQRFIEKSRGAGGLHLHPRRGGIRDLARALSRGAVALQVVDQNQRLRGLFVPFFGKLASTERAAATLAVRKGFPVGIGYCVRVGSGFRFRIAMHEILQPERPADGADVAPEVKRLVLRINRCLEELILQYPEQYLWIHDRYRTQPAEPAGAAGVDLHPEPSRSADAIPSVDRVPADRADAMRADSG